MEHFIVSARKYRPQTFDSVVGQEHITTTLRNAIKNNQLAHAFLFCGPRGVGKTSCARILAKTINCENITASGEACNECDSCRSFNQGNSFNIHELDAASNNSVDDIRTLVEQVRFAPQAGKYKTYIIDEVHMLSASAFNAFLKTLEEPPPYAIFILATTEKHKILPTILSRCQIFDFRRITIQDAMGHMQDICSREHITADADALHIIAQKSEGCMRDALSILDKIVSFTNGEVTYANTLEHLNILDYDYFFRVMDAVLAQDAAQALLLLDEVLQKGFEADSFLEGLSAFVRDVLVCKDQRTARLLEVSDNLRTRYRDAAAAASAGLLVSALNLLNEAAIQYKTANNKRLQVEMTLIKMGYLQQAVQLVSEESGAVSKKKVTEPAVARKLRAPFPQPIALRPGKKAPAAYATAESATLTLAEEPEVPVKKPAVTPAASPQKTVREPAAPLPPVEKQAAAPASAGNGAAAKPRLSDLKTLRKKLGAQAAAAGPEMEAIPLSEAAFLPQWVAYIEQQRKAEKLQLLTHLELARPEITGDAEICILCRNDLQRHFIEEDKMELADFLKQAFRNPALVITLRVNEALAPPKDIAPVLSAREQYQRMVEKYPLIGELKDKLNLELDY
ncbi:DNA polymerase III subunit gamma/tau [Compostibacter hankyongensis]|uniref:DNA polymerase III subunit gamma/tau n=1 Tax=Compostibacter hankyongensis TaxID=1007089 RepID=A0ABP8G867_9BACT